MLRVVYTFSTAETQGNNTQFLKLTNDDLKPLRALAERLGDGGR